MSNNGMINLNYGRGREVTFTYLDFCFHVDDEYNLFGIMDRPYDYIDIVEMVGNCVILKEVSHKNRYIAIFRTIYGCIPIPVSEWEMLDNLKMRLLLKDIPLVEIGFMTHRFMGMIESGTISFRNQHIVLDGNRHRTIDILNNIRKVSNPKERLSLDLTVSLYDSF